MGWILAATTKLIPGKQRLPCAQVQHSTAYWRALSRHQTRESTGLIKMKVPLGRLLVSRVPFRSPGLLFCTAPSTGCVRVAVDNFCLDEACGCLVLPGFESLLLKKK